MRELRLTGLWLALLASVMLAMPPASAAIEDDIEAALQSWADAYNSHVPARVAEQYANDAVFWGTTSPTLRATPEAILEYFGSLSRRPNAHVTIGEHVVRIVGDVALVTGLYSFADRVEGETVVRPSRFSFAFRRADGRWRLVQHHSSRLPE